MLIAVVLLLMNVGDNDNKLCDGNPDNDCLLDMANLEWLFNSMCILPHIDVSGVTNYGTLSTCGS